MPRDVRVMSRDLSGQVELGLTGHQPPCTPHAIAAHQLQGPNYFNVGQHHKALPCNWEQSQTDCLRHSGVRVFSAHWALIFEYPYGKIRLQKSALSRRGQVTCLSQPLYTSWVTKPTTMVSPLLACIKGLYFVYTLIRSSHTHASPPCIAPTGSHRKNVKSLAR